MLDEGVESRSDGVHRIHWTRIDSDGKVHFLFVRDLEKSHLCWMRWWKVVPMASIGSIGHEYIPKEKFIFYSERLRQIPPMLDEGVESSSDGVHQIHWKRIDSKGKVHFSIPERLRKFHSCCMRR